MKNILILNPGPIYRPDLPDWHDLFEHLSDKLQGSVISWTTFNEFKLYKVKNFTFYGCIMPEGWSILAKIWLAMFMLKKATSIALHQKIDVIVAYEPMYTGLIGVLLKYVFHTKLIVELNSSDTVKAVSVESKKSLVRTLLLQIYKITSYVSFTHADAIRVLTNAPINTLKSQYGKKQIFSFHYYVPTHWFMDKFPVMEKTVLFVGFPFARKGVDVLINAFKRISPKCPDFTLRLIGHQLEEESKNYLAGSKNIQVLKPVFYDRIRDEFLKCYCFVLPSREEGMGRVLVEAMACGKPVIGSNTGGIPFIIVDGENGFLFQPENVDDLADKLFRLLSNIELAKRMGQEGMKIVKEKFSSEKYYEYFQYMIDTTTG